MKSVEHVSCSRPNPRRSNRALAQRQTGISTCRRWKPHVNQFPIDLLATQEGNPQAVREERPHAKYRRKPKRTFTFFVDIIENVSNEAGCREVVAPGQLFVGTRPKKAFSHIRCSTVQRMHNPRGQKHSPLVATLAQREVIGPVRLR